jgi:hypothetical protein
MSARRRRELGKLLAYLTVIVLPVPWMFGMLVAGWNARPWGYARHLTQGLINATGVDPAVPYVVGVSLVIGLALSMLVDSYKRFQGVLLWVAIFLGSALVLAEETELVDVFVTNLRPESSALVFFFIGCGMYAAGVRLSEFGRLFDALLDRLLADESGPGSGGRATNGAPVELRRELLGVVDVTPPLVIFVLGSVAVVYGTFEAVVAYHPSLVQSASGVTSRPGGIEVVGLNLGWERLRGVVASGVFLVGLYKYTSYENNMKVIQIGPARSGKSAEFGGLQLALESFRGADYRRATGTNDLRNRLLNGRFPKPTDNVDGLRWLEIEYRSGVLFQEKLSLQTIDYPGALLRDVLAEVEGRDTGVRLTERASSWVAAKRHVEGLNTRIKRDDFSDEESVTTQIASVIWDCIRHADRIVLTIPLDDFLGPIAARGNEREYVDIVREDDVETEAELKTALGLRDDENVPESATFEHDGRTFYIGGDRQERSKPESYINWYQLLRSDSRFFENDIDFLCVVTKADHALDDFGSDGEARTPLSDYEEFREHVVADVLAEANGVLDQNFVTEDFWPVWYDVREVDDPDDDEESLRIETDRDTIPLLRGSRRLLDRLER